MFQPSVLSQQSVREESLRTGMIVLATFAAAWAVLGILIVGGAQALTLFPILISVLLLVWGWRSAGMVASRGPHVRKLVGLWSMIEGIAIFIASYLLQRLHRGDLIFSATVIIVGLHLFPLAGGIPAPLYYITGVALVSLGLIALLLPGSQQAVAVCFGAALILWLTVLVALLRARRGMMVVSSRG